MPKIFQKLKSKLFYDIVDGKKMYSGGLEPHIDNGKDFNIGIFGWGEYEPKFNSVNNETPNIVQFRNTCTMASSVGQKQSDEKVPLNIKLHVQRMKKLGNISSDGFSSLRANQEVIQKDGVPEAELADENFDDDNWERYSKYEWNQEIESNAKLHKSASFWSTKNKNEILKLLDSGRVAQTGMEWYSGFNMRSGFTYPWTISKPEGYLVGGHAFRCNGYEKNYQGKGLHLRFKNSYGVGYGDNGDFYMPIDYALKVCYTFYFQLDIQVDVGKFLQKYEGKFVKAKDEVINGKIVRHPAIYRIKEGKKEAFENMTTYFAFEGVRRGYELVNFSELENVPVGTILTLGMSPHYEVIKNVTSNIDELVRLVNEAIEFDKNFN